MHASASSSECLQDGVVASVAGQMSYPHGGNMCSTCATTLAMAFAAGLVPDPGTCTKEGIEAMLSLIMMHSSRIQGQWLAGHLSTGSRSNERRQVHEVVQLVKLYDTKELWKTGDLVECFGPVLEQDGSQVDMDAMNMNSCGEDEKDKDAVVHGADIVLQRYMEEGAAFALTYAGHSVCVYRACKDRWYVFDPLHGGLTVVHGDSHKVHDFLFACANTTACNMTGLQEGTIYCGVIANAKQAGDSLGV